MTDLEQRLAKLQKQFHGLRIMGGEGVNVYGNMRTGYVVEVKASVAQSGVFSGSEVVFGCTDPVATNFDPDANIDDGSCEYTGACCTFDGSCSEVTEASCLIDENNTYFGDGTTCEAGTCPIGACCCPDTTDCFISIQAFCEACCPSCTYQGDDTTCDPNPCGPCPEVTLLCDSIHASKCKCGFAAFDGSGTYYLVETYNSTNDQNQICCSSPVTTTCAGEVHAHNQTVNTYDPSDCTHNLVQTICTHTIDFCNGSHVSDSDCTTFSPDTVVDATNKTFFAQTVSDESTTSCAGSGHCVGTITVTHAASYVLSSEYITSDLISNVEAALPAYFGHFGCDENEEIGFRTDGQNCTCFASRELSEDETCYEINRFKYKFTFSPSITDFTINWNEHTEPDAGGPSDNPMSEFILAGATESSEYEVLEPTDNGTISITDITCTPA